MGDVWFENQAAILFLFIHRELYWYYGCNCFNWLATLLIILPILRWYDFWWFSYYFSCVEMLPWHFDRMDALSCISRISTRSTRMVDSATWPERSWVEWLAHPTYIMTALQEGGRHLIWLIYLIFLTILSLTAIKGGKENRRQNSAARTVPSDIMVKIFILFLAYDFSSTSC